MGPDVDQVLGGQLSQPELHDHCGDVLRTLGAALRVLKAVPVLLKLQKGYLLNLYKWKQ